MSNKSDIISMNFRCNRCIFWEPIPTSAGKSGLCRKALPKIVHKDANHFSQGEWPSTYLNEWCGEGWLFNKAQEAKRRMEEE